MPARHKESFAWTVMRRYRHAGGKEPQEMHCNVNRCPQTVASNLTNLSRLCLRQTPRKVLYRPRSKLHHQRHTPNCLRMYLHEPDQQRMLAGEESNRRRWFRTIFQVLPITRIIRLDWLTLLQIHSHCRSAHQGTFAIL